MNTIPHVAIIIINYNGIHDTRECLNSLSNVEYRSYTVIVVDNASTNDELAQLQREFPDIVGVQSEVNGGFSKANNMGITAGMERSADFFLFLNNDTVVEQDFLTRLVETAIKHDRTIVTPTIKYYADRSNTWMSGGYLSTVRASGFAYRDTSIPPVPADVVEVSFASGCCMLFPRTALEEIGVWDEEYFLYVEDVDLCYRAVRAEWRIVCDHRSIIYHKVNATTTKDDADLPIYYGIRNRLLFAKKNLGYAAILAYGYVVVTLGLKILYWTISGRFNLIRHVLHGCYDFINGRTGMRPQY